MLASAVAKEHVEAPRMGFAKLFEPRDYQRTYGEGWFEKTKVMLSGAAARLIGGPSPMPVAPPMQPVGVPVRLAEMRTALASQKVGGAQEPLRRPDRRSASRRSGRARHPQVRERPAQTHEPPAGVRSQRARGGASHGVRHPREDVGPRHRRRREAASVPLRLQQLTSRRTTNEG